MTDEELLKRLPSPPDREWVGLTDEDGCVPLG